MPDASNTGTCSTYAIRVRNSEGTRENNSFGLTALRSRHVRITRTRLHFHFRRKSTRVHDIELEDPPGWQARTPDQITAGSGEPHGQSSPRFFARCVARRDDLPDLGRSGETALAIGLGDPTPRRVEAMNWSGRQALRVRSGRPGAKRPENPSGSLSRHQAICASLCVTVGMKLHDEAGVADCHGLRRPGERL
jgi:hypothetical protein